MRGPGLMDCGLGRLESPSVGRPGPSSATAPTWFPLTPLSGCVTEHPPGLGRALRLAGCPQSCRVGDFCPWASLSRAVAA